MEAINSKHVTRADVHLLELITALVIVGISLVLLIVF